MEKAYRLCRRCEEVLEKTLQTQNLRIIGNRVRQLKRQAVTLLDLNKPYRGGAKKPLFIKFLHFSVFLFASFILVDAIATFDYSDGHLKTLLPHFLLNTARKLKFIFNGMLKTTEDLQIEMNPLVLTVSEQCTKFSEEIGKLSSNFWDSISEHHLIQHCLQNLAKKIPNFSKVENNEHHLINCAFTAISGLLLQMILCFWSKSAPLIKTSQILSWFLLTLLSFNVLLKKYELFQLFLKVNMIQFCFSNDNLICFQIFCPLLIIYTMSIKVSTTTQETSQKQKKLKKRRNIRNLVKDDRSFSDLSDIENFTENERSSFNKFAQTECDTFNTAKRKDSFSMESDLNASLSNLALGTVFPKPLLSPSKLNNVTRNPWTAGGFWNVPYSCSSPEPTLCNLSRSSSHSSGFGSHTTNDNQNFNSLPASPGNSISGGDDHISIFSEPAYHFNSGQFELYKTRNGSVAASICTPNSGYVGMENVFRQPMDGMLWSRRGNAFSYTSSVINADWPGSLFKNICGNQTKTNSSFTRIRD